LVESDHKNEPTFEEAPVLYLVPTRGRPENALRLARAFRDTRGSDETELLFCVDDDDPKLALYEDYLDLDNVNSFEFAGYKIGPRRRLNATLNHYAQMFMGDYDIIGFMGDDHTPRTPGWDVRFVRHLDDARVGIVYGDDLVQRQNLPTEVAMTSNIIRTLGYMAPPTLVHMYLDNFWRDLGQHTGTLAYLPDVIIEHVHPVNGRAEWDDTYVEAGAEMPSDEQHYQRYLAERFVTDVQSVQRLVEEVRLGVPQVSTR
jgi:hypothetical protein